MNILSADIGGTKTWLALNQRQKNHLHSVKKQKFSSNHYVCFDHMLVEFLEQKDKIDIACFAIAGPVQHHSSHQTARVTNLPWLMDSKKLQTTFNIQNIFFINDFQAMGYAIEHLSKDDLTVLQQGKTQPQGVKAVIGAGTGLGEAILVHSESGYNVLPSEGGHQDFAANDELEIALLHYLHQQYEHVSYERVLSGAGLITIFQFLVKHKKIIKDLEYQNIINSTDPAAEISQAANRKSNKTAEQALALFMKLYGAKAGNLALTCLPTAGLYISGGIAEKNLPFLKNSDFIKAFNAKGRMQALLENIPVSVITNQEAGLIGATQHALRTCQNQIKF